jgi:dihydroneopterin aldolase
MADLIEVRGLLGLAICGALPEEQARRQPIEVDVDVEADLSVAGASDDLADTLDYAAIIERLDGVLRSERFTLLERLAQRLAEVVLDDPRADAVTVAVRKLRPPVPQQVGTTGVRVRRARPAGAG